MLFSFIQNILHTFFIRQTYTTIATLKKTVHYFSVDKKISIREPFRWWKETIRTERSYSHITDRKKSPFSINAPISAKVQASRDLEMEKFHPLLARWTLNIIRAISFRIDSFRFTNYTLYCKSAFPLKFEPAKTG